MNLYIYVDESGVLDKVHNDYFVFGWIICIGKGEKENNIRLYRNAENKLRKISLYKNFEELKGNNLKLKHKNGLYRSMNKFHRGAVVITQNKINENIFNAKKSKQRYLDYALKRGIKEHIMSLMKNNIISQDEIDNIYFYVDEHTTATDGKYEFREGVEQEFKHGTFNYTYNKYFPPILPDMRSVFFRQVNSKKSVLVRGADIIANTTFYHSKNGTLKNLEKKQFILYLP